MQTKGELAKKLFSEKYTELLQKVSVARKSKLKGVDKKIETVTDTAALPELYMAKIGIELGLIFRTFQDFISQNVESDDDDLILSSSFSLWRESALQILLSITEKYPTEYKSAILLSFAKKVDYELLPEFAGRIKMKYAQTINAYNFGLGLDSISLLGVQKNAVYKKLIKVICKWLLNIELIADLVKRLKQYEIFDSTSTDVMQKCKSKWKPTGKGPTRHILRSHAWNMALRIHSKLSSTFYSVLRTFAVCNVPAGFSLGLGLLKSLATGTALSKILIYPAIGYFGVLTAGLLSTMLFKIGETSIKGQKAMEESAILISCFQTSNDTLADLLRRANVGILDFLECGSTKGKTVITSEIKNVVEMLMEKKKPVLSGEEFSAEPVMGKAYMKDYLKSKDVEEGWVHVSKINIEKADLNEELEGDMLKLSIIEQETGKKI